MSEIQAPLNIIRATEWLRFLELAKKEALTEPGKALILNLQDPHHWAGTLAAAQARQTETLEILPLLERDALWGPLSDLQDPSDLLERLERGSVLEVSDWRILRRWIYAIDSWSQIPREELRSEIFRKALTQLTDPLKMIKVLDRLLTPEGELSENASPRLAALFLEIRQIRREIDIKLDFLVKTLSQKGILQENFSDVRDGRYVIPVKISSQGDVDGIIYEASASRQTVFVEPKEISPLNNRLRQRQNELEQETYTVLSQTSEAIRPFSDELKQSIAQLTYWDSIQARARIGRHYSGKPIQVTQERRFQLRHTAHPLLWWSLPSASIIRNPIEFGHPAQTLLITGPNTGGKTVLLKTLGLAGLCARTGFPFPAAESPVVPFFDSFFADLGDPQSIEEHLSSFSGHVLKFKEILEKTTENSLVLIDELNSATDPQEGAALGRALLETVMAKNAMIVTTSHDPNLKALALTDRRILNASMTFDETSRSPTYHLILGTPGRSRALETAERLGIPASVIQLARSYLTEEHHRFEQAIKSLEQDLAVATEARKSAVLLMREAEQLKKEWTERTEHSVNEMMGKTRQKLRRILEQAQDEVRTSLKNLAEKASLKNIEASQTRFNQISQTASLGIESALTEEAPEIAETLAQIQKTRGAPSSAPTRPDTLTEGSRVRIPKWKNTGTVLEISGDKIKVALGTLQMTLSRGEVEPILEKSRTHSPVVVSLPQEETSDLAQIDLRGIRFEEAMSELERFLDRSFRSGHFTEVTVIHGLGSGALREGAHKLLRKLPYIRSFRDGGNHFGGAGATLVEFERSRS